MNTLIDTAVAAVHENGFIIVRMESGEEIRFPVAQNPRLARGTPSQLNHIEISPFGLHWPELDEDLSFRGLIKDDYGQFQNIKKNMTLHVSLGEKKRIITPEELSRFEKILQLDQIAPNRYSRLLIAELLLWNGIHGHDPSQVAKQIKALENSNHFSGTKNETEFKYPPLKGLWHKHFFDAHFVPRNLKNEWSKDKLQRLVEEVCDPAKSPIITREMVNELIHRLTEAMETRNQQKRLTGEWIIFDKHDGQNYYLCLASHADGDEVIFSKLKQLVFLEFSFLREKYAT